MPGVRVPGTPARWRRRWNRELERKSGARLSANEATRGFQVCDGALRNGQIHANTPYPGSGISQQIVTESTSATLDVKFTDNAVVRHGSAGTVG